MASNLNCNHSLQDGTQHAETRLMQHRLRETKSYNLEDHEIFTTLEPCAQCSGMMAMQKIRRVVYGQTDARYGKAIERLALDSRAADGDESAASSGLDLTDWLHTAQARGLFGHADRDLAAFVPVQPENAPLLQRALEFRSAVAEGQATPTP